MFIAFLHHIGIRIPRWIGIAFLTVVALALLAGVALAQNRAPAAYGFVYLMGGDTLGVERVTPGNGQLSGEIQMRGQPRMTWTAMLGGPGGIRSLALAVFQSAAPDARLLQRAVLELNGDTVRADISSGAPGTPRGLATRPGAFMLVNASAAMIDLMLARARMTPAEIDTFPVFLTTGGQTIASPVRIWGDSAVVTIASNTTRVSLTPEGTVREASMATQNLRMVRIEGPALAALRIGGGDYSAVAGAPYTAEQVKIAAPAGHVLAATLTRPAGTDRVPAIVTITGSGPQDRDEYIPLVPGYRPFRQLADTLGRRGIAVLRYDDRGTGESSGTFQGSTSADFAEDVRTAVRWLRARPDIDSRRIFLVGHSEGGLVAPLVAASDSSLAGVVLLAGPAQNGLDIIRFQQRYAVEHDSTLRDPVRRDSVLKAAAASIEAMGKGDPWMKFFFSHDPLATARRVSVPAFVVQGGSDQQVTADQAEPLAAALRAGGNRDVTVKVFPDLNHLFLHDPTGNPANYVRLTSGRIGPEVMGAVVEWLVTRAAR